MNTHLNGHHPERSLGWYAAQMIQDRGRIDKTLLTLTEDEIFDDLSKHNPYFHSEHEVEAEKLEELRWKLSHIHEKLWEVISIIDRFNE